MTAGPIQDPPSANPPSLLGRIAVQQGLISMTQLTEAVAEQGRYGNKLHLGEILVERGWLTTNQVERLLQRQRELLARQATQRSTAPAPTTPTPAPSIPNVQKSRARPKAKAKDTQELIGDVLSSLANLDSALDDQITRKKAAPVPTSPVSPTQSAPTAVPTSPPSPAVAQVVIKRASPPPAAVAAPATAPTPPPHDSVPAPALAPPKPPAPTTAVAPPIAPHGSHPSLRELRAEPSGDPSTLNKLLHMGVSQRATDIHFHASVPMRLRIRGALVDTGGELLNPTILTQLLRSILNPAQQRVLDDTGQIDLAHSVAGVGRFRANIYRQNLGTDGVFRFLPTSAPTLEQLGLPNALAKVTSYHQGMVLITGPSGCGKSTTLSALVDIINTEREDHILTIEDPVEILHPSKRCVVNQRQVDRHTTSFPRALRAALREDPDIIVIGELRDFETISLAMTAAETGHLVLATLHTDNAIRTIDRLIGSFSPEEQGQARTMLSESLRAIVSQKLIPSTDGGRACAYELLYVNQAVGNMIRESKTFQLRSALMTGKNQGMVLLDHSLIELVKEGRVLREDIEGFVEDKRLLQGLGA